MVSAQSFGGVPLMYDHVMEHSCLNGERQAVPPRIAASHSLFSAGSCPFMGVHGGGGASAVDGVVGVASQYASHVKHAFVSAASSWILGRDSSNERPEKPVTQLPIRYAITLLFPPVAH